MMTSYLNCSIYSLIKIIWYINIFVYYRYLNWYVLFISIKMSLSLSLEPSISFKFLSFQSLDLGLFASFCIKFLCSLRFKRNHTFSSPNYMMTKDQKSNLPNARRITVVKSFNVFKMIQSRKFGVTKVALAFANSFRSLHGFRYGLY